MIRLVLQNKILIVLDNIYKENALGTTEIMVRTNANNVSFDTFTDALWDLAAHGLICGCRCMKAGIIKDKWWGLVIHQPIYADITLMDPKTHSQLPSALESHIKLEVSTNLESCIE